MINFEFSKPLPDQVTTERLQDARAVVARIGELDPGSTDAITLAERLQGLSRAVSAIVLTRGTVEVARLAEAPNFDAVIMPTAVAGNILRHFDDPETRLGRTFAAQPSKVYSGANLSVLQVDFNDENILYEAYIPTDHMIDRLLMQEPALWNNMSGVWSQDSRSGQSVLAYPFCSRFSDEGAPARYLATVQELSAELVSVSV